MMIPSKILLGVEQRSKVFFLLPNNGTNVTRVSVAYKVENATLCKFEETLKESEFGENIRYATIDHTFALKKDNNDFYVEVNLLNENGTIDETSTLYSDLQVIAPTFHLQTDKPIYRPGEKMRFFIITIDPLKHYVAPQSSQVNCKREGDENISRFPEQSSKYKIFIKNAQGEVLKLWSNVTINTMQVFDFQFYNDIPEGVYTIFIKHDKIEMRVGSVKVNQFVLPRFTGSVEILDVPSKDENSFITAKICAKYTNGGIFKGTANVTVEYFDYRNAMGNQSVAIDGGCSQVRLPYKEQPRTGGIGFNVWRPDRSFKVRAVIREHGTDIEIQQTGERFEQDVKIKYIKDMVRSTKLPSVLIIDKMNNENHSHFIIEAGDQVINGKFLDEEQKLMLPNLSQAVMTILDKEGKNVTKIMLSTLKTDGYYNFNSADEMEWSIYPGTDIDFSGKDCPKSVKIGVLSNATSKLRQVEILPLQPNVGFKELSIKLSPNKCVDRDDNFGHFKCNEDGTITCLTGWTGDNCIIKLCQDNLDVPCSKTAPSEKQELKFHYDEVEVSLGDFYGVEFSILAYTFNQDSVLEKIPIKLVKMNKCNSPIEKLLHSVEYKFNETEVVPGQKVNLQLKMNGLKEKIQGKCLVNIYDKALDNFKENGASNTFTFDDLIEYLTYQLSRAISFEYRSYMIMARYYEPLELGSSVLKYSDSNVFAAGPSLNKKREYFPEGWIFKLFDISEKGDGTFGFDEPLTSPDSLTKYQTTSICFTEKKGLYAPNISPSFIINKPFHIEVQPPKYLVRSEIVNVPMSVVFEDDEIRSKSNLVNVKVSYNSDQVSIEGPTNFEYCTNRAVETENVLYLRVKGKIAGEANITVEATTEIDSSQCAKNATTSAGQNKKLSDTVVKMLRLKPEGETVEITKTNLLCSSGLKVDFDVESYEDVVPESLRVYSSALTNGLGMSAENLDRLVKKPYGCGEQNLASVYPSVSVLDYITKENIKETSLEKMKERAVGYIHLGYNRELTFKHPDGSFSAFGTSDKSGSTWLTLHVIEVFSRAQKYMNPELDITDMIKKAYGYIGTVSSESGQCIIENGTVFDNPTFTGAESDIKLYKGISLSLKKARTLQYAKGMFERLKNKDVVEKLDTDLSSTLKCVAENYKFNVETLPPIIVAEFAYTLALIKTDKFADIKESIDKQLETIVKKIINRESMNESRQVEIVSYYLMVQAERNVENSKVLNQIIWLLGEQNSLGGYYSTLATVLGVDALSKFSSGKVAEKVKVIVKLMPFDKTNEMKLGKNDVSTVQLIPYSELPKSKVSLQYTIETGKPGECVILKSFLMYNKHIKMVEDKFVFDNKIIQDEKACGKLEQRYCISPKSETMETGMLLVTQNIPSGYSIDETFLSDSPYYFNKNVNPIKYEFSRYDNMIYFYFNGFTAKEVDRRRCVQLKMAMMYQTLNISESRIKVEDYYQSQVSGITFYKPKECLEFSTGSMDSGNALMEKLFQDNNVTCPNSELDVGFAKDLEKYFCQENDYLTVLVDNEAKNSTKLIKASPKSAQQFDISEINATLVEKCFDINEKDSKIVIIHEGYNKETKKLINGYKMYAKKEKLLEIVEKNLINTEFCKGFVKIFTIVKDYLQ